ncbi:MAG: NosD domain-containing protein [Candidatus Binatia bacterium]
MFVGGCGAPSYADIASAMAAVADGDLISVCPGTYTTPVVVTREVTLRSTGGAAATTLHVTNGPAVDVRRSGVRIEGFTLRADNGAAVSANAICPLGAASCSQPNRGSNVTVTGNAIPGGALGIAWSRRIDCATISDNTITDAAAAVVLDQQEGAPAVRVTIGNPCTTVGPGCDGNRIRGGGSSGRLVRVAGLNATVTGNVVEGSATTGVEVGALPPGAAVSIAYNDITDNGEGVTIRAGGGATTVYRNNITHTGDGVRHIGLANETGGVVHAEGNWWNSDSGPHRPFADPDPQCTPVGNLPCNHPVANRIYAMAIEERGAGSVTKFIEFLCKPQPAGSESTLGVCDGVTTADTSFVVFGRSPDISPKGLYISFVSAHDANLDASVSISNCDALGYDHGEPQCVSGDEVFLLNRKPSGRRESFCIGGKNPGADCDRGDPTNREQCEGSAVEVVQDGQTQPVIANGSCALVSQVSDDETGTAESFTPRVTVNGNLVFTSTADMGGNTDMSREVFRWSRKLFRKDNPKPDNPKNPSVRISPVSDATSQGYDSEAPSASNNGRYLLIESEADPIGQNADHNREIFQYDTFRNEKTQVTNTVGVDNRRPQTSSGKQVLFDSTAANPVLAMEGGPLAATGARELFYAVWRGGQWVGRRLTETQGPGESWAGGLAQHGKRAVFTSTADFPGYLDLGGRTVPNENADHNREVFFIDTKSGLISQVTHTTAPAENVNPVVNPAGRFIVFESTASATELNPASTASANRNVFLYDVLINKFTRLSNSPIGDNFVPRISKGRFVVWQSTANLTDIPGGNPAGDPVIYLYDRRLD